MRSVKFFELIVFAFFASLFVFITGARAETPNSSTEKASLVGMMRPVTTPLPPDAVFPPRPLLVDSADVPAAADHTEVITVGLVVEFSDGCAHRFLPNVQKNVSQIDIVPLGQKISHGLCPAVMRPTQQSVELGLLEQGQYLVNVHSNDGSVIRKSLFIR